MNDQPIDILLSPDTIGNSKEKIQIVIAMKFNYARNLC